MLCLIKLLVLCLLIYFGQVQAYKDYKNYKIFEVTAHTEEQQQLLKELSKLRNIRLFNLPQSINTSTRVLVAPTESRNFQTRLSQSDVWYTLRVDDVSEVLEQARSERASKKKSTQRYLNVFENFYQHNEINEYLEALAEDYPTRVFLKRFGRSYERRFLQTITITNGDGRANKKIIFVDAAMHAREWITPSMALHIINELVFNYAEHAKLLLDYDWVVLPVVNADGYEFTHTDDRYWRKTRKPSDLENDCYGTDPNRNFGYYWGLEEGASTDPCDETYMGEKAFSEPETQTVRDIMWSFSSRLKFYFSMHSYGNYFLLPWGHTGELPLNFFDMMDVADAGAMAIVLSTNSMYTYGSTYHVMYPTSGDSTDYALGEVKIPIAIAAELPAGGWSGFDPPIRQIEDIVTESWTGLRAMAEVVVNKY